MLAANEALATRWMSADLSDRYGKGGAATVAGPNGGSYMPVGPAVVGETGPASAL